MRNLSSMLSGLCTLTLLSLLACQPVTVPVPPAAPVSIIVLSTTDVHGWLTPLESRDTGELLGGLSELVGLWHHREGYDPSRLPSSAPRPFLVLDSGDMWTGPPESTLAEGVPMVEAYNLLGYDAVALGNHEFDFGVARLRENAANSRFPYLCSNVHPREGQPEIDFCQATTLIRVQGIPIGIIGLSTIETPRTTWAKAVEGIEFKPYLEMVRKNGQKLLDQGAQVLILVAHEGVGALVPVVEALPELPIRVVLGGHWHRETLEVLERDPATPADDVILLSAGHYARAYGRIVLTFQGKELISHGEEIVPVKVHPEQRRTPADARITAIGQAAQEKVRDKMVEVVGIAGEKLRHGPSENSPLGYLITDSWLEALPEAELAFTNRGGIRQDIEAGPISMGDLFGVLPFLNALVMVELTPEQLRDILGNPKLIPGGMRYFYKEGEGARRVVTRIEDLQGKSLEEGRKYKVLTTDFLYLGGDNLKLKAMDPHALELGIHWRDPLIQYFRKRGQTPVLAPSASRAVLEP